MSKRYEFMCDGHNSIYNKDYKVENYSKRKFKVIFNEPENGINKDTGILLLINGFGANINSKVYKKMRDTFSDKYNLVTLQCDYMGSKYMENYIYNFEYENISGDTDGFKNKYLKNFNVSNFINDSELKESTRVEITTTLDETLDNLNDMGIMQALDNITATLNVISIIYNNNYKFNTKKIMICGQSHGAYLAYLCNRLCGNLYTHILDNSAWVYPKYISNKRYLFMENLNELRIGYKYLISEILKNDKMFSIEKIYKGYENRCKIVSYHGTDDSLVSIEEKKEAIKYIENLEFNEISKKLLDNKIFKSVEHGLGADFIELFDLFYNSLEFENGDYLEFDYITNLYNSIIIDYEEGIPKLEFI